MTTLINTFLYNYLIIFDIYVYFRHPCQLHFDMSTGKSVKKILFFSLFNRQQLFTAAKQVIRTAANFPLGTR